MFNFLKKVFPELKKESNYYIQAVSDIIVKQHSIEPLDGQDVFVGEEFIGQINKMSSSLDPISSGYYRGFYLNPVSDHKKELIDGIYNRIKKAIDDEVNTRINGKDLAFAVNKELLKELNEKQKTIQKLTKQEQTIKEITIDKNEVALNYYASLTDLVFSNFRDIFKNLAKKKVFCNVYLKYNNRVNIEITCNYVAYDKSYRVIMHLRDWTEYFLYASDENWPERRISVTRDGHDIYPIINEIKKYYIDLGAKTDDDIKQMFIDDIGKQLLARMEANIKSKEDSIKYTKKQFDIKVDSTNYERSIKRT